MVSRWVRMFCKSAYYAMADAKRATAPLVSWQYLRRWEGFRLRERATFVLRLKESCHGTLGTFGCAVDPEFPVCCDAGSIRRLLSYSGWRIRADWEPDIAGEERSLHSTCFGSPWIPTLTFVDCVRNVYFVALSWNKVRSSPPRLYLYLSFPLRKSKVECFELILEGYFFFLFCFFFFNFYVKN